MTKTGSGEMQGVFIGLRGLIVTISTDFVIGGWFLDYPHVGFSLGGGLFIPLVAESTPFGEMGIGADQFFINKECLVL